MLRSDTDSPTPIVCSTDPDDDDDDVLSVGCESPPPASASASTSDQDSLSNQAAQPTSKAGSPNALSFSIDNILRPEFGTHPVDLTKHKAPTPKSAAPATQPSPAPSPPEMLWPAWVYCTRYSDRPSSGPRTRRSKRKEKKGEEKRPRTAFSGDQLSRLKSEFSANRYLTEKRRQALAGELNLNEAQIKIWFQNKRAKIKKATGSKNPLALQLMAQGLYNHSTVPLSKDEQQQSADTDSENTSYL